MQNAQIHKGGDKMIDIFIVTYHPESVRVTLSWDANKSATVQKSNCITTADAETLAIGTLWGRYLRNLWTTGQFAKAGK